MEIAIELDSGTVALVDVDNFLSFSVLVDTGKAPALNDRTISIESEESGDIGGASVVAPHLPLPVVETRVATLDRVVRALGVGYVASDGALYVHPSAIRAVAERTVAAQGASLPGRFDADLRSLAAFARQNGWSDEAGAIRAPIVWGE